MKTFINTCGIIFVIAILLTFALKNNLPVEIQYYYNIKFSCPVWAIILIPFFLGIIGGNLLDVIQRFKLKGDIRKLKKEFKTMNSEQ
jgi:uncharacterized integral membrane protein